jgi:peroxisomal membrane protein 2
MSVHMGLDPASAWEAYNAALVDPSTALVTKSITAGVIIGAGDAAAQTIENSKSGATFDVARYLRWAIFGLVLQGPWNHAFYLLLDGALPPTPDPFTLVTFEKVGIDQFVQAPIFTVIILCFFALVEGKGLAYAKDQIANDLGGILIKNWSVFLPATVINLAFCPPPLRVLFLNTVFFGWVIYLSLFLNENAESDST